MYLEVVSVIPKFKTQIDPKGNESGILVDPVLWEIRRERIIETIR